MKKRLLIVEDEPAILYALQLFFRNQGFQVDTSSEREEAEGLVASRSYAAIIADLRLSDSRGAEGLEIASFARERSPDTKVLLLTAYGSPEIETEAWRRGVHAVLHKPQPLAVIAEAISSLLAPG